MGNGQVAEQRDREDEEKSITLLRVSNGDSKYPGNFTIEEEKIINNNIIRPCLHLFSGSSDIGGHRVDFSNPRANIHEDVFDFLREDLGPVRSIIIDAPYNKRFADEYQKIGNTEEQFIIFANATKTTILFDRIDRIDPEIIILKSWNYYCLKRYRIKKCYVCYAGGYRKPTFLIIMKRKQRRLEVYL